MTPVWSFTNIKFPLLGVGWIIFSVKMFSMWVLYCQFSCSLNHISLVLAKIKPYIINWFFHVIENLCPQICIPSYKLQMRNNIFKKTRWISVLLCQGKLPIAHPSQWLQLKTWETTVNWDLWKVNKSGRIMKCSQNLKRQPALVCFQLVFSQSKNRTNPKQQNTHRK